MCICACSDPLPPPAHTAPPASPGRRARSSPRGAHRTAWGPCWARAHAERKQKQTADGPGRTASAHFRAHASARTHRASQFSFTIHLTRHRAPARLSARAARCDPFSPSLHSWQPRARHRRRHLARHPSGFFLLLCRRGHDSRARGFAPRPGCPLPPGIWPGEGTWRLAAQGPPPARRDGQAPA